MSRIGGMKWGRVSSLVEVDGRPLMRAIAAGATVPTATPDVGDGVAVDDVAGAEEPDGVAVAEEPDSVAVGEVVVEVGVAVATGSGVGPRVHPVATPMRSGGHVGSAGRAAPHDDVTIVSLIKVTAPSRASARPISVTPFA